MNNPECPSCGKSFPNEDFCPVHNILLVVPEIEAESEDPSAKNENSLDSGGKISSFMSRLGLRPTNQGKHENAYESNLKAGLLPEEMVTIGWKISGAVFSSGGLDIWPIKKDESGENMKGCYHRFRTGALTAQTTYDRIKPISLTSLPKLVTNGTIDLGGVRTDFEVVSAVRNGVMLNKWLAKSRPSEERAKSLLKPLSSFLTELSNADLQPIVLEASQLVFADDGKITLTSLGSMFEVKNENEIALQYCPEFNRSSLLPKDVTAPEVIQQSVLSENAAVFSVGQILSEAIWGQCLTHKELMAGEVPFHTLADERLGVILRGCLWPQSNGRWTQCELNAAIDCSIQSLPTVKAWASLVPGSSSTSFSFAGDSYWCLEDVLRVAVQPQHWSDAAAQIEDILQWAQNTSWAGKSKMILEEIAAGRSNDFALVKLSGTVNPEMPLNWRDLDLSDAEAQKSLAALAHRALKGESDAIRTVQDLFDCDLRGAFFKKQ